MPQSPHLNPPQECGYNNDDNEDEMDQSLDSLSLDMPPEFDLNKKNMDQIAIVHAQRGIPSINIINAKEIKVINRRTRSYAVGQINIDSLQIPVGCVITDEESANSASTTDDCAAHTLSSCASGSSADSKDSVFGTNSKRKKSVFSYRFRSKTNT
eukprot:167504_1